MKLVPVLTIGTFIATSLAACGGGGNGNGGNQPPPPPPPPPVGATIIDNANATMVAGTAADAAIGSGEIGGLTGAFVATGGINSQRGVAADAALKVARGAVGNVVAFKVPIGPTTSACAVSGSVTVSGDIADPLTFTMGDTINVDSDNCDEGDGQTVDGLLSMTVTSFQGDLLLTAQFLLGMDLVITDFSVTEGNNVQTANGDISMSVDTRQAPVAVSSISGDSYVVVSGNLTESLTDFSTIYTEDSSAFPIAWTNDSMGVADRSDFAGTVSYETVEVFQGSGANYPFAGQLLVTGANNATLLLRVIDDSNVQIDADYDGDGNVDETIDMTWEELSSQ